MPIPVDQTSDFDKLKLALSEVSSKFGSLDDILEAFGLLHMPTAQRYGILFGCLVFIFTVSTVVALLTFGGTFRRIAEQAETGKATVEEAYQSRVGRALLLERLLDSRERMLNTNYADREQRKECKTNLTKMLMNIAKPVVTSKSSANGKNAKEPENDTEEAFKTNYVTAYRKCQDKPGGATLAGRPEARYEAYARAYAGCGNDVNMSYRRSYARHYEALACDNHKSDDKYLELYEKQPEILIGSSVRLEPLDAMRHLAKVYDATSGQLYYEIKSYDPQKVWGFQEEGPFRSPQELHKSFVFRHYSNQAAFAIVQNLTDRILGVIMLSKDNPKNLSIQLDPPIVGPSIHDSMEQLESCFLLMDRLFANGYRRIQISVDSKDAQSIKLADRLGFTYEGCLLKEMIVKDSSRDSNVYGMLNSDWDKGARTVLFRKLYGVAAARADEANNKKEEELDEQQRVLAEQKAKAELDAKSKIE